MNPLEDPVAQEEFHRGLLCSEARGHRQRAGASTAVAEPAAGGSPQYSHNLVTEWCYGLSSAQHTNKHALLAYAAGARGGYLHALTQLGSGGRHAGNCSADLMKLVQQVLGPALIPMYICLVPFFISRSSSGQGAPEWSTAGFILPHIWFAFLFKYHKAEFYLRFAGCTEAMCKAKLRAFWSNVHDADPRKGTRPDIFGNDGYFEKFIPVGCHGDKVPCTKKDALDITTMFGLMGVGVTQQLMFFLFGYFAKCKVDDVVLAEFPDFGATTLDAVWEILCRSFIALETGKHPTHDHRGERFTTEPWISLAGTDLAGGFCALLWLFRSDADYIHKDLNIPGYWAKNEPCYSCFCNKTVGPNHFLTFGPMSSWPTTIFLNMADFFLHCANHGKTVHRLFRPRGPGCLGLHILLFMRDSLHVMDLGISQGLLGSVFWLLCFGTYVLDGNPFDACRIIFGDIDLLYRANRTPSRIGNLELAMFLSHLDNPRRGTPSLNTKGAETRHLVPIVDLLWRKYSKRTPYDNHVQAALSAMSEIYLLLDCKTDDGTVPLFLSPAASDELRSIIDTYLIEVKFLETIAKADGLGLFHLVRKDHDFFHLGFESQFAHPSSGRTYINEDFMQHMRLVGMAQRHAVPSYRRCLTVCERVALGRSFRLFIGDSSE